jgi:protein involved in polysaccharide export with SLBB domain
MNGRRSRTPAYGAAVLVATLAAVLVACGHRGATPPAAAPQIQALLPPPAYEPGPAYRIRVNDELDVKFLFQPDMSEHVPVRPDGAISLPSTGELHVVGMTPLELEKVIIEKSSTRLRNPEVIVVVTRVGEQRVYIGGEVMRPGFVVLTADMTLLQAVLQSGGFKRSAKLQSVLLLTPAPGGTFSAARVDMGQVVNDGVAERVRLHPDSVVYVPQTWISEANDVVDEYVRGLFPALPKVGVGASLTQ